MKIALLGDISFNGKFNILENKDAQSYLSAMADYLNQFDYVIGNLESPLTSKEISLTCKGLHLKSPQKNVELLKFLGINIVGLANNHMYDYGKKGFSDTIDVLNCNNIDYYGVANKQSIIEDNTNKLIISGYCCFSTNPSGCNKSGVNPLVSESILKQLKTNESLGFMNIISMHWGDEYIHYPRLDHINVARTLAENHDIILHGHHPHVIQGIEKHGDSLLSYSLGNFCMDNITSKTVKGLRVTQEKVNRESIILEIEIENNKIISYKATPIYDDGKSIKISSSKIIEDLETYSASLKMNLSEYRIFRNKQMIRLQKSKTKIKDFKWFVRRLNYYYIGAVLKGIVNKKKYTKALK
jgi:poly-gamma-glutamate capsule biosynthesis protein CapA/YwtB (metallophosphatase superfamily)